MDPSLELFFQLRVPEALGPFIRRALYVDSDEPLNTLISPRPTGYQYAIWVIRGELIQELGGKEVYGRSSLFLAGQIKDHPIAIRYTGNVKMLLIEFTALGCFELLKIPGSDALNKAFKIKSFGPLAAKFERELVAASEATPSDNIESKFKLICQLFDTFSQQRQVLPRYMYSAINEIEAKHGAVKLNELCATVGISRRQLTRKFTEIIGVPPKYFCQVLQLNKAMEALAMSDKRLISEIANNAGYYDEAHLIHTVQKFFGFPASSLVDKEHPAVIKMHSSSRKG